MLAMILFVFFLTYMPGFIIKVVICILLFAHHVFCILHYDFWILHFVFCILDHLLSNQIFDKCYMHPTLHAIAYVFNWASVWVNPIIYIKAQKKYQVKTKTNSVINCHQINTKHNFINCHHLITIVKVNSESLHWHCHCSGRSEASVWGGDANGWDAPRTKKPNTIIQCKLLPLHLWL